mgnify:CR=1 FL=1
MKKVKTKTIIGWREFVDLPEWKIRGLRAKIDTGALTSSLHVEDVKELPNGFLEFHIILNKNRHRKRVVAKRIKKVNVKSSIGVKTSRWYVSTKMRIGTTEKEVLINLVRREGMNFRMLVGRRALRGDFSVDVSKSFLALPPKKRRRINKKK